VATVSELILPRVRGLVDRHAALLVALLPKRVWDDWNLPVANMAPASSMLTLLGGAALGITGFFTHMRAAIDGVEFMPPPLMLAVFLGYVLATPRGVFSIYLVISGLFRAISSWIDEPCGDPLLTGVDALVRRLTSTRREKSRQRARLALERRDEPDRRYDGQWAGLTGVDFVIVAARRKPGWTRGSFVITSDGWFTLGEPFDRPMPNGLRTIYPLTLLTTADVLRKGLAYELPPLRQAPARRPAAGNETAGASRES